MSADINLDNVNVDLTLIGGADFGLDAVANALITGVKVDAGLGAVGVTLQGGVNVGLDNIKANANVDADVGLDEIRIKELPVVRTDSNAKIDLGLDDIRIAELPPFHFELSFRPIRIHFPLNYSFCFELFGKRLFKFSVCGEGMVITEDFKPHATERCG